MTTLHIKPGARIKAFSHSLTDGGVYKVLGVGLIKEVLSRNQQRASCVVELESSHHYHRGGGIVTVDVSDGDLMIKQKNPKAPH